MKAKFFILIMGGIEMVTLMREGVGASRVANLAHIGGMVTGLIYMYLWMRPRGGRGGKKSSKGKTRRNLRLVVDNDKSKKGKNNPNDPKYWN